MKPVKYLGKIRGYVEGDTYYTTRHHQHYFVRYRGFGISAKIAKRLSELKISNVSIIYHTKESGRRIDYNAQLDKFIRRGRRYTDQSTGKPDLQYILPINEMETRSDKNGRRPK